MASRKIKTGKRKPSPETIRRYKDFGRLLTDYEKAVKPLYKKPLYRDKRAFLALLLIILMAVLVFEYTGEQDAKDGTGTADSASIHVPLHKDSVIKDKK